ncbi:MAG: 50S ribosomal protein L11 [Candidatus Micrarchaeaceae archaeon]
MAEILINALVEGGKASGGPPLGPALGPTGANVGAVIAEINQKTKEFEGIRVPVKIYIDTSTKKFRVEVGSPSTSSMIMKELKIQKGAKDKTEEVGNIDLEKVIKIAKSKGNMLGKDLKSRVKQVLGTCKSMNIKCEGMDPKEVIKKIDAGEIKIE